jgi:hypothetical protein
MFQVGDIIYSKVQYSEYSYDFAVVKKIRKKGFLIEYIGKTVTNKHTGPGLTSNLCIPNINKLTGKKKLIKNDGSHKLESHYLGQFEKYEIGMELKNFYYFED